MSDRATPTIVVVSGLPGSGKSTLGASLAAALGWPLLDKDEVLERGFDSQSSGPERRSELSREADERFLDQIARYADLVAVSFWRRVEVSTRSGTPLDRFPPDRELVEVWCDCSPEVAAERFFARQRHPAHGDAMRDQAATLEQFRQLHALGPLRVGRLVRVDTSGPVDGREVAGRVLASEPEPLSAPSAAE